MLGFRGELAHDKKYSTAAYLLYKDVNRDVSVPMNTN